MNTIRKTQIYMNVAHGSFYVIAIVCIIVLTNKLSDSTRVTNASLKQVAADVGELKNTSKAMTGTLTQATTGLAAVTGVVNNLQPVISNLDVVTFRLNGAMLNLQRPCDVVNVAKSTYYTDLYSKDSVMPCGLFADTAQTMGTVRGAFGQVEVAAIHENKNLGTMDKQEAQLFADLHTLLVDGHTLLVSANTLISDKDVVDFIKHADNIADHVDALSGDIQTKTHEIIYPAPCKGKTCWIKRTYTIVNGVIKLGEPAYYWGALVTDVIK